MRTEKQVCASCGNSSRRTFLYVEQHQEIELCRACIEERHWQTKRKDSIGLPVGILKRMRKRNH